MNDVVICLFAQVRFDKAALGLVGAGRRLADDLGSQLYAVVLGSGANTLAPEFARVVDRVVIADQVEYEPETCLSAVMHLCSELSPRAVLLANDTYSQEIAPRLAYRLGGSAVGDGVEVRVEGETLRVGRQVYGGKAQAVIEPKRMPPVVGLRAPPFPPPPGPAQAGEGPLAPLDIPADTPT